MSIDQNPYPRLEVDLDKLKENLAVLVEHCHDSAIEVCGVVKGFSAIPEIVRVYAESGVKFIASSRVDQLKRIREAGIREKPLALIRIPMLSELSDVIALSDLSLHSDVEVLRAANAEAEKQGKRHNVILMMDLGDLREGFWHAEDALNAAIEVERELKSLHLAGVGVNLSCYGSVEPTVRNMQALADIAADIEKAIGRPLEWVSGGASTSVRMTLADQMPHRVNLLRIGEFALLGGIAGFYPAFLHRDVFTLKAEVIECRDKPSFPIGRLSVDAFGRIGHYEDRGIRRRALVALGRVDYGEWSDLKPRMPGVEVLGASSDHTILDVEEVKDQIHVGDVLEFDINYAPMVYLTQSTGVKVVCRGGA